MNDFEVFVAKEFAGLNIVDKIYPEKNTYRGRLINIEQEKINKNPYDYEYTLIDEEESFGDIYFFNINIFEGCDICKICNNYIEVQNE